MFSLRFQLFGIIVQSDFLFLLLSGGGINSFHLKIFLLMLMLKPLCWLELVKEFVVGGGV